MTRHLRTLGMLSLAASALAATAPLPAVSLRPDNHRRQSASPSTGTVLTSVRVLDARRQSVPDLARAEFRVFEDGVEQQVTFFQPWIGGRSTSAGTATSRADQAGRIFIVLIDDLHLLPDEAPRLRAVLTQIRDMLFHDGDLVGLVSTGSSSIAVDLTVDDEHRRFNEALAKVQGQDTGQRPADSLSGAHTALSLANEMLKQAATIANRRKSFIFISTGYAFNPFTESRYARQQAAYGAPGSVTFQNPFTAAGQPITDADVIADLAYLTRAAVRANVVFYPVDPRGLLVGPGGGRAQREWATSAATSVSSLHVLGEDTGGFCTCNTNDYRQGLARIDDETDDYYMIGYTPTNLDPLPVRRAVRIEITRTGAHELKYRHEYTVDPNRRRDE